MISPKHVTEKQLAANRANVRRSTGPRTAAGKSATRWNAPKHGVLSQSMIPPASEPGKSRRQFRARLTTPLADLTPVSPLEEMFIERAATCYWRLGRVMTAGASSIALAYLDLDEKFVKPSSPSSTVLIPFVPGEPATSAETLTGRRARLTLELQAPEAAMPDVERLRTNLIEAEHGDHWEMVSNTEIPQEATLRMAEARPEFAQISASAALEQTVQRTRPALLHGQQRSIQPIDQAILYARYEATLDRQFYCAFSALDRLQRRRAGDYVPPPIDVDISAPDSDP